MKPTSNSDSRKDQSSDSVPEDGAGVDSEITRLQREIDEQLRKLDGTDNANGSIDSTDSCEQSSTSSNEKISLLNTGRISRTDRSLGRAAPDETIDKFSELLGRTSGHSHPATSPSAQATVSKTPVAALFVFGLLAGAVVGVAMLIPKLSSTQPPLRWQPSCGSAPVNGSRWWPVLGPAEAVDSIRSRYCGDAYVTAFGYAQVASFSSFEEASSFAQRLSADSAYSFRVGEPHTP